MDLMRGLILGICQHLLCKFQIGKRGGVYLLQFHDAHSVAVCVPHLDRVLWCLLIAAIGALYYTGVLDKANLFMISVLFYVCDLICVLIWCPFRLILKNRCCTTCRIFNWDHLMMFSPLIFMGGFYAGSLVAMAAVAWLVWELCVMMYPERFWDHSNEALKCSECTDKLCTQYCHKLRE